MACAVQVGSEGARLALWSCRRRKRGIAKDRVECERSKALETARNFLSMWFSLEQIASSRERSEVQQIANELTQRLMQALLRAFAYTVSVGSKERRVVL